MYCFIIPKYIQLTVEKNFTYYYFFVGREKKYIDLITRVVCLCSMYLLHTYIS